MTAGTTLADRLVEFTRTTRFETLPPAVVVESRRRWIDSLGCAIGALDEPAPTFARRLAGRIGWTSEETTGTSCRLFGGGRSAPDWAAFSNGVHIRYLDCNDTYLSKEPAHPSDNFAAVMAVGEHVQAPGTRWIEAAAIAYEVQCRLADAFSIRARGWDHVTYGNLSSCLAAAKLLNLDADQTRHALGIAGTTAAALRLTRAGELSMWKGCAFAHAARNGVFAALLAREGITGPAPLFEGEMGFWQQVCGGPFELEQLGGPNDGDWMLPKTSIKFVPAEYHSQSAVAAAYELRQRLDDPRRITAIRIDTFKTAVEIIAKDPEKWRPKTRETADHSLPYCFVVALLDGQVTAAQFADAKLNDPLVLDLVAKTQVVEDPELTARYPKGIPNRITLTLEDGSTLEAFNEFPPGHDQNPLSDEQLAAKFHGLADPILGEEKAQAILDQAARLDQDDQPWSVVDHIRLDHS
ncbi:2-methylcitrate dehydratase [Isosphaera pallida ATCC 43644]|uniref:2-methylcitrate dehydratase n=1 Tax=Isosphaera pallida (strain ATCC 43644 / DSM 9630 / IS1B) TaxID=575540 RepID=E8R126_ISOPI|nr:MmgE/PrpD family protein [Isosphaera pallida]ADV63377.1 2-methylcitrate dehydratase [Isosphaera pallida ATCC 43644]